MFSKYKIIIKASAAAFRPLLLSRPKYNEAQHLARLFASNNKDNRGICKPPGTTKSPDECTARPIKSAKLKHQEPNKPEIKPSPGLDSCGDNDIVLKSYPDSKSVAEKVVPSAAAQDSRKPHLMKDCPPPESPWDDKPKQKSSPWGLIIGLIVAAAALYALYDAGYFDGNKDKDDGKSGKSTKKSTKKKKSWRPKTLIKNPESSKEIPNEVPYLLIGGGTASFSAFRSIKSLDPSAKVLVISSESDYPYMRPPLSKEIWYNDDAEATKKLRFKQWNGTERTIYYEPDDFYANCTSLIDNPNGGVAVARGWTVTKLDVGEKTAYLDDGYAIKYEKCLIATGSTPNNLPVFKDADESIQDKITLYREIFDFQELDDIINDGAKDIAIVGGGFLGSELACALARRGQKANMKVHQVFREQGNMGKVLPEYLSQWTTKKVKEEGVHVIPNATVDKVLLEDDTVILKLSNGEKIEAAHVIVAVGASANTSLAASSRLEVDPEYGGYLVNAELMARSSLWIAGDCAGFYDTKLGRRRVEHHDHAVVSGRLAGENMTGAGKPYFHQSMFWSDLGPNVGYEAIGIVDSALPTVGVFAKATDQDTPRAVVTATDEANRAQSEANAEPVVPSTKPSEPSSKPNEPPKESDDYGKGVIFYLRDDVVVGIVLWNVFNRMSVARQVLQDERKYDDLNEVAKLFNIHEE